MSDNRRLRRVSTILAAAVIVGSAASVVWSQFIYINPGNPPTIISYLGCKNPGQAELNDTDWFLPAREACNDLATEQGYAAGVLQPIQLGLTFTKKTCTPPKQFWVCAGVPGESCYDPFNQTYSNCTFTFP